MKILAIESSGTVASVALLEDDRLVAEMTVNDKMTHSQTLLPMLEDMCRRIDLDKSAVDAVAVCAGPGSFTGLRIGAATAKGLAMAWNKPIIPVPTLEALAYHFPDTDAWICPLMDARRGQVYTGLYRMEAGAIHTLVSGRAVPIGEILAEITAKARGAEQGDAVRVIFLGDGVPVFREKIEETFSLPHTYAPVHVAVQRAGALGVLAGRLFAKGAGIPAEEFAPEYLRLSQAERERIEKERNHPMDPKEEARLAAGKEPDHP